MKATMIALHKGMLKTLLNIMRLYFFIFFFIFKFFLNYNLRIENKNRIIAVQSSIPKTDETTKYFEMLRDAWA